MTHLEWLREGSSGHIVTNDQGASFSIRPRSSSEADLIAFQPVARQAIRQAGGDYDIHITHESSDIGLKDWNPVYDLVLIVVTPRA